jgi:hypothetical protein
MYYRKITTLVSNKGERMSFKSMLLILVCSFSFLQMDCKDDPPVVPPQPSILVSEEDVGVTEVWVKIATQHIILPSSVTLQRNGAALSTFTLTTSDTVIADTTLQPKHSYAYTAIIQNITSNQLQVTTMDTTSHNITWQTFTFGGESGTGSSVLYDVAIINDTLAYAVGEIRVKDSTTGQVDPEPYGIAIWNGENWQLKKLFYTTTTGNTLSLTNIRGIFIISPNDIWLAAGSIFHWDGSSNKAQLIFSRLTLPDQNTIIQKLWGTSSNDMYGVGTQGTIVHYNGSTWTKLESGTTATINDIWGVVNQQSSERTILCAVSEFLNPGDRIILSITPQNTVDTIAWIPQREIRSVWLESSKKIFTAGEGIFLRNYTNQWKEFEETPKIYSNKIRGNGINDIVAAGGYNMLLHYNGSTWKYFDLYYAYEILNSIDYKNNTVIAAGYTGGIDGTAKILMGKHN